MYSYKEVKAPPWAIQALFKCEGNSAMSLVEAKLPVNWYRMSPKCWEAYPHLNSKLKESVKIEWMHLFFINFSKNCIPTNITYVSGYARMRLLHLFCKLCRKNVNHQTYYTITRHIVLIWIAEGIISKIHGWPNLEYDVFGKWKFHRTEPI